MTKPIIAVDIDDVIVAESEFVIAYSNDKWGHTLTVDDYDEHWARMWGVDHEELLRRAAILHEPGMQTKYRPIKGAKEALEQLSKRYRLVAVTSRRTSIKEETIKWIDELFENVFEQYNFTGFWDSEKPGGHLRTKGDAVKDLGARYLIDDQPKHCISAAAHGIETILYGGYKIGRDLKLPMRVQRCKNWGEVLEYFDGKD